MITAVVYKSNSGSCERYARRIGDALSLPVYEADHCPLPKNREVIFVSWLVAGKLHGIYRAKRTFLIRAIFAVGMSGPFPKEDEVIRSKCGIAPIVPVLCLQGRYDASKLPFPYNFMMKVKTPQIIERYEKIKKERSLSPEEQASYDMARNGKGEPASWDGVETAISKLKETGLY